MTARREKTFIKSQLKRHGTAGIIPVNGWRTGIMST
jgi:hypothetical protein